MPIVLLGIPLVYWLAGGLALALAGCADRKRPNFGPPVTGPIPPLDPPPPERVDDPVLPQRNPIFQCIPPEESFLLVLRGYGQTHPLRVRTTNEEGQEVVTDELTSSPSRTSCSVWAVDRLGAAHGERTEAGIPYRTTVTWINGTVPFLPLAELPEYPEDPTPEAMEAYEEALEAFRRFNCAVTLHNSRAGESTLDHVYRGCYGSEPPDPIRDEGSWADILGLAGLPELGQAVSFSLVADMTLITETTEDPGTCEASIDLKQAVRTPDGLQLAEGQPIVLPLYREEACDAVNSLDATEVQEVTICGSEGGSPCETQGMTELERLTVTLIRLPISTNAEDAMTEVASGEQEAGAFFNYSDEGLAVLLGSLSFRLRLAAIERPQ